MATTTSGQISVTPMLLTTMVRLEEIAEAMRGHRYEAEPGEPGWGSVRDGTDDVIGDVMARSRKGGRPEAVLTPDNYPRQARGRLYWDEPDKTLIRAYGGQANAATTNRLRAADITFAEYDENQFSVLVCERNDSSLRNYVIPELRSLIESLDGGATISRDGNPLAFGDDDFFRWLLYRATHSHVLDESVEILTIRAMSTEDNSYRLANLSRGVDLSRAELLALVAGATNRFGPAKFIVTAQHLGLTVSLEVTAGGQFSIYRTGTDYAIHEDDESAEDAGLRLLQDVAFELLPRLKQLHNADSAWRSFQRDEFIQECRVALVDAMT